MNSKHLLFSIIATIILYIIIPFSVYASDESPDSADISATIKDLFSSKTNQIEINNIPLHFPILYDDFISSGWEYTGDSSAELGAFRYSPSECFKNGSFCVYALILNTQPNPAPVSKCTISGIFIDQPQVDDAPQTTILLPGDIMFGKADKEQILSVYGQPSSQKQEDNALHLIYEYKPYQRLDLFIDSETNVLNEIDFQNMPEYTDLKASISGKDPADSKSMNLNYSAPRELGSDLLSYNIEFEKDLYHLPAPVTEFLKNGWTLNEEKSDLIIAGQDFGWVCLQKNDHEYSAIAVNYNKNASEVQNCYITSAEANQDQSPFSLQLPMQLTLGTSEADLLSVIEHLSYKTEADSDVSEKTYSIEDSNNAMNYILFTIDTESSFISGIEISHIPEDS